MPFECVLMQKEGRIAKISIDRPDKLNALNIQTISELTAAFEAVRDDDETAVVILTGAGGKSFAAGADIGELAELDAAGGKAFAERGHRLCNLMENLGKPIIACVNGFALGGGCELAMACDIRIAGEKAKLGQPEINLGTIPGYGGTQRLPRLVPRGIAMDLLLTGRIVGAEEALRIGLVDRVVSQEELEEETMKLAESLVLKPAFALKAIIEAVNRGGDMSFEDASRLEASLFGLTCGTADMKEGTAAFLEKRKATFTGR